MTRVRGAFVTGLAVALLLGCATATQSERFVLAGSAAQNIVILPFNVAARMPPELDGASPIVREELEIYLGEQGKELKTVSYRDARRIWLDSIHKVRAGDQGAKAGYDEAARVFVLELARHAEFDTVIAPSLFIRKAHIQERAATWDGVVRKLEFELPGPEAEGDAAEIPFEGVAPAASLHAVVFDAQGNKLQESQGGLDLLVRVRQKAGSPAEAPAFEFVPRSDLFTDRTLVREGIAEALAPFLPRL